MEKSSWPGAQTQEVSSLPSRENFWLLSLSSSEICGNSFGPSGLHFAHMYKEKLGPAFESPEQLSFPIRAPPSWFSSGKKMPVQQGPRPDKQPRKLTKQVEMPRTSGRSPACSHTDSWPLSQHKRLAQGMRTMPSPGVQEAKETNGEEVHGALVLQNNVAAVLGSGFSSLVTSPQTTDREV